MKSKIEENYPWLPKFCIENTEKIFFLFLLFHMGVWTLLPIWVHPNAPLDVIEGLVWGHEWQLGYPKHPPLQAWLLEIAIRLSDKEIWSVFLLSQIAIIISFWAIWQLSTVIVGKIGALISTLLLEGIFYFNFTSPEFNPNVLQIPFWALIGYSSYRAIRFEKKIDWILLGIWIALSTYSKYFTVFLVISLIFLFIFEPKARRCWITPGPFLASGVSLLLLIPHIIWLITHDFLPFNYAMGRAGYSVGFLDHILFPLKFVGAQFVALIPAIILLFFLLKNNTNKTIVIVEAVDSFDRKFVAVLALGPIVIVVILSAILGMELKSMWGTPLWCFIGLFAMVFLRPAVSDMGLLRFFKTWMRIFVLFAVAYGGSLLIGPYVTHEGKRGHFPGKVIAIAITEQWRQITGLPLNYVVGSMWLAGNISFYSPDRPSVFVDANPIESPWVNIKDMTMQGAVIVWQIDREGINVPARLNEIFPEIKMQKPLVIDWQTRVPLQPVHIGWAIAPPQQD